MILYLEKVFSKIVFRQLIIVYNNAKGDNKEQITW